MKYTPQEIYNALMVIKTTCHEQGCDHCPFCSQGDCVVAHSELSPEEWELNAPENWVAFR